MGNVQSHLKCQSDICQVPKSIKIRHHVRMNYIFNLMKTELISPERFGILLIYESKPHGLVISLKEVLV